MKCSKHPTYKASRFPKSECDACLKIWHKRVKQYFVGRRQVPDWEPKWAVNDGQYAVAFCWNQSQAKVIRDMLNIHSTALANKMIVTVTR